MKKGFLVVIDGVDGAGKTTQIQLLQDYLKEKNLPHEVINFPRYEDNLYGQLVKRYLEGKFGTIDQVNPYLVSLAYAGDRMLAKTQIETWLEDGKVVITNRYVSANKAHLGANLPEGKKEEFFKWLDKLEYETNKMPREDLTILLMVDPKMGQKNVKYKHQLDIHEKNLKHLTEANKIYLKLSKLQPNWVVVNCMEDGKMRSKEDIHNEFLKILSDKLPT